MPGSHLVCDADLDRADVGVSTAPADAARRELGGIGSVSHLSNARGTWTVSGCGREIDTGGWGSGGVTESADSLSRLRVRDGKPKRLSREPPRPLALGGGGKFWLDCGSGEGRCTFGAGILAADILAGDVS